MNQQEINSPSTSRSIWLWWIVGLMIIIAILDFWTSATRIVGFLYIGPILIACFRLGPKLTYILTGISISAILLLFWTHLNEEITEIIVTNRLLAAIGVMLAAYLGNRAIYCQHKLDYLAAEVLSQQQLLYLREDFSSTLTHDLKTPLLGAIATIEAFDRSQFGPVTSIQQQTLATMKRSHQSSLQLLDTLLEVYRYDSDGIVLYRSPVNLVDLAQKTISELATLADSRETVIRLIDRDRSWWVDGDGMQLSRVLTNLISNSIKYSPHGSTIEIFITSHDANYLVLQVMDNSYGIPIETLPYLFDRFYPGHSSRDRRSTGLGLYLSRQIIDAHDGKIWAENRTPRGTILSIQLPQTAPAEVAYDNENADSDTPR